MDSSLEAPSNNSPGPTPVIQPRSSTRVNAAASSVALSTQSSEVRSTASWGNDEADVDTSHNSADVGSENEVRAHIIICLILLIFIACRMRRQKHHHPRRSVPFQMCTCLRIVRVLPRQWRLQIVARHAKPVHILFVYSLDCAHCQL